LSAILLGNMQEFLTWALFNTSPPHCSPAQNAEVFAEIAGLEAALGHKFEKGYNATTKCMRNSLDEVKTAYRPLIFYITIWCQNIASYAVVRRMGYVAKQAGGTRYWFRPGSGEGDSKRQPLVFFHGIGVGISQNLPLLRELHEDREVQPLVILSKPPFTVNDEKNPKNIKTR
jgi:hypothetical protein